jgi:endonuclease/exonuclease/phosphatase family metal-dependent hydrolase
MQQTAMPSRLAAAVALYPAAIAVLLVVHLVAPQRHGLLALTQIFAPHLGATVILFVPLAIVRPTRPLRLAVALALAVTALRFAPGAISLPPPPTGPNAARVTILSWNLEEGGPATATMLDVLRSTDAAVVALQELTPRHAGAIEADEELIARFPYRVLVPQPYVSGIGLLSRWPITASDADADPILIEAQIELPDAATLTIIDAHPFHADIQTATPFRIPIGYDATARDMDLVSIRQRIDAGLEHGRRLVLVGDLNLSEREPAFDDLSAGLWDAHRVVGLGLGSTWRPTRLEFLPFGVLRIDHVLGSPDTRPLAIHVDCSPRASDHCIVTATVAIE